jgi:hypothetical protein
MSASVQACDRVVVSSLFPPPDVHDNRYSTIHIENPTRRNCVSEFYFMYIRSSTCFGRHSAHHQVPKTALAASGFAYVEGCWTCSCWTTHPSTLHVCKTRVCKCSFRLLMIGGVSPKTCWALYIHEIKFWYTAASCWIFYVNYTMMHGSANIRWYPTVSFLHSVK